MARWQAMCSVLWKTKNRDNYLQGFYTSHRDNLLLTKATEVAIHLNSMKVFANSDDFQLYFLQGWDHHQAQPISFPIWNRYEGKNVCFWQVFIILPEFGKTEKIFQTHRTINFASESKEVNILKTTCKFWVFQASCTSQRILALVTL